MKQLKPVALLAMAGLLGACAGLGQEPALPSLHFIGEQRIVHRQQHAGTTLGGFSGIDYDAARGGWAIVTDDRCTRNPARYYDAGLEFDGAAFRAVRMGAVHYFLDAEGKDFAASSTGCDRVDVESVRFDPIDGSIWYSSEGDRRAGLSPFVRHAARDGALLSEMPLPAGFAAHRDAERGSRYNLAFEGMAFAPDGRSLWVSMEGPLYEDGPIANARRGAVVRMTNFTREGRVLRQFAYPVDAIPVEPAPGKEAEIGVSEILALENGELLVLERASVQQDSGLHDNHIRLYATDSSEASDTSTLPALAGARYTPSRKRLVLDLNQPGMPRVHNLEGMAWGPRLPNGNATLVMVSDDNYGKGQVTQLLLFEVRR